MNLASQSARDPVHSLEALEESRLKNLQLLKIQGLGDTRTHLIQPLPFSLMCA